MINPRHIAITGASSGLGEALAAHYGGPGVRLSLHGRNGERLHNVQKRIEALGAEVDATVGDIADPLRVREWILARDNVMPIDLVIANAGISAGTLSGAEGFEQSASIFATNVGGVLNTVHPLLSLMMKRGHGQIAIVSSLAGFRGVPGASCYAASKAAVRVYGEGLRSSLLPYGVEVNVVCPGFIDTPMTKVNPFRMPFMVSPSEAAAIIARDLRRNRARIAFPLPMVMATWFLAALPQGLSELIVQRMPRKPGLD